MTTFEEIKEEFYNRIYSLDFESITELNENHNSVQLNNVIVGLEDECFGFVLMDSIKEFTNQLS